MEASNVRKSPRILAALLAALALVAGIWSTVATRRAAAWFDGDRDTWMALAQGVSDQVLDRAGDAGVSTGNARFDGEWDLVTCQMAVIGLSQVALVFPEAEERFRPARDACLDWLGTPEARSFGTTAWGLDALDQLGHQPSHAYLGYVNLAFALDRRVRPRDLEMPHQDLHDALSIGFAKWMQVPVRQLRTYPGETYPPDQATILASLAVRADTLDQPRPFGMQGWIRQFRQQAIDPDTGWVFQSLDPETGEPIEGPRGSGTAFTAGWLAWVEPELSADLYAAHRDLGHRSLLGFGGMREYPPGVSGSGDVDSGPVILGIGVSPTGFALAGARAHGDRVPHRRLYRTAHLFGLPVGGGKRFLTGGGIGNAILLAMLTAPSVGAEGVIPRRPAPR